MRKNLYVTTTNCISARLPSLSHESSQKHTPQGCTHVSDSYAYGCSQIVCSSPGVE